MTHEFRTLHGRIVRDGGGIQPDVKVENDSLPNITYYLAAVRDSDELVDTYEQKYIAAHPTIAAPCDFELTDSDFNDFKRMVLASRFKYDALSAKQLDELEKLAKFEGYYDDAKSEFAALRAKLKHNLSKDLDIAKESIKRMLEQDIVSAYYFQSGAVENALRDDKQVKAAFDLLADNARYQEILKPQPAEAVKSSATQAKGGKTAKAKGKKKK